MYLSIADLFPSCEEQINNDGIVSALSCSEEFSSPLQVTPLFRSLAAGIPSPQFSESVSYPNNWVNQKIMTNSDNSLINKHLYL